MPVVPMFHANAWGLCQAAVMAGASLAMPGPNMQPKAIAELMEAEKVTLAAGVPTIWMGVLPELEGRDLSSLREILCGGSAVPKSLSRGLPGEGRAADPAGLGDDRDLARWRPPGGSSRRCSTAPRRSWPTCAPRRACAIPLVDLRIVEPGTDEELPWDGEARGELQARGPWIAAGYYNDERSADSFTEDGWLRTGDVATISPNGYVRLVDRTKDLVKSGGEWISSRRARERDHGPPEGRRGGRDRHPGREVERAPAGLRRPGGRRGDHARRAQGVPRRARAEVVDPERPRDHRRGPEDLGRQVLQEDAARAVREGDAPRSGQRRHPAAARRRA